MSKRKASGSALDQHPAFKKVATGDLNLVSVYNNSKEVDQMADSERTKEPDTKNGLANFIIGAAGESAQEIAEVHTSFGDLKAGFCGPDIFLSEASHAGRNSLGTCVLLQDPSTWGRMDKSKRRFLITAGHCVALCVFGRVQKLDICIRMPRRDLWTGNIATYKPGKEGTEYLYESIVIRKEQIFLHPKFNGYWDTGFDLALIAIPETEPSIDAPHFTEFKINSFPKSISVNGYPCIKGKFRMFTHIPYFSARSRSDNNDNEKFHPRFGWTLGIRESVSMVDYPLGTLPGMSGGAVVINGSVQGIHNAANKSEENHSWGTVFTPAIKSWIEEIFPKWSSAMTISRTPKIISSGGDFTRGTVGVDIVIIEAKYKHTIQVGSGVILQNPGTWGSEDTSGRYFVVTALYNVALSFGKPTIRVRIPQFAWADLPNERKEAEYWDHEEVHNWGLYTNFIINSDQYDTNVFLPKKAGDPQCALIVIPSTLCKSISSTKNSFPFSTYRFNSYPDNVFLSGYPFIKNNRNGTTWHIPHYYMPHYSSLLRENGNWQIHHNGRFVHYPLNSSTLGMGGGALVIDNCVVGIHHSRHEDRGQGILFTPEIKAWMQKHYQDRLNALD